MSLPSSTFQSSPLRKGQLFSIAHQARAVVPAPASSRRSLYALPSSHLACFRFLSHMALVPYPWGASYSPLSCSPPPHPYSGLPVPFRSPQSITAAARPHTPPFFPELLSLCI